MAVKTILGHIKLNNPIRSRPYFLEVEVASINFDRWQNSLWCDGGAATVTAFKKEIQDKIKKLWNEWCGHDSEHSSRWTLKMDWGWFGWWHSIKNRLSSLAMANIDAGLRWYDEEEFNHIYQQRMFVNQCSRDKVRCQRQLKLTQKRYFHRISKLLLNVSCHQTYFLHPLHDMNAECLCL